MLLPVDGTFDSKGLTLCSCRWLWRMSPGVWFTEAYFSQNLLPLKHLYVLELAAEYVGYTLGQYTLDIAMLFVIGLVYRVVAYLGLVLLNRKRQI